MNFKYLFRFFVSLFMALVHLDSSAQERYVLVFSKTAGFRHDSAIAEGKEMFLKLGEENNIRIDTTENAEWFTAEKLSKYDAVVFLSTSGPVFDDAQKQAFRVYIEAGGGFMGIHAASTTEYEWPWYGELVGAYFESHPPRKVEVELHIQDRLHPATSPLPKRWRTKDEIYNFKWIAKNLNVLITVDEKSYKGGTHGDCHPLSWYHEHLGGRSFYTALGHDAESLQDPLLIAHILGGLNYVLRKQ